MNSEYFNCMKSYNSFISLNDLNFFNIVSINIRSASSINKFNLFRNYLSQMLKLPEIIAVQETWFNIQYLNLYSINSYQAIHCPRNDGYGGTTIYVKSTIKYKTLINLSDENVELIAIELPDIIINNRKLILISVYRSPKCIFHVFLNKIETVLDQLGAQTILLVGDINIDMLKNSTNQRILVNLFSEFNMYSCHSHITRPTSKTSIDWVFSTDSSNFFVHCIENSLSDHNILSCGIYLKQTGEQKVEVQTKCIKYQKFGQILDKTLPSLQCTRKPEDLCKNFINKINSAANQSTQYSTEITDSRRNIAPWMNERLLSIIKYKDKILKRKRKKQTYSHETLRRICVVIKICGLRLMENYYTYNLNLCLNNVRKTWLFLNIELGRKNEGITEVVDANNTTLVDDHDKAVALNEHFITSVEDLKDGLEQYADDDINMFKTLIQKSQVFSFHQIERSDVEQIIGSLDPKKSPGHDGIIPKMLQVRVSATAEILQIIFNNMISTSKYPDVLKVHKIIPIPKSPNAKDITSFRPIAVLSVIDKIFEKLMFEQLSNYLHEKHIFYDFQFGFKKGSGTLEAVVNVMDYVCGGINDGYKGVGGVFFDFSKAFDLVDHRILLKKLKCIGLSENTLELFADFLRCRTQYVQVQHSKSNILPVNYGVPQGSVLGPLLFKVYINDLMNIPFNGKLFMFADDICIFYKYRHETVLKAHIEYDAAILSEFARINKLVLNSHKTQFIKFRTTSSCNDIATSVNVEGTLISESENVTYLGATLNQNLVWDPHITKMNAKISSATGLLYKFRNKFSTGTKILIYNSLIHSRLTYIPMIYGSRESSSLKQLQVAQNKALKLVFNLPLRYPTVQLYTGKAVNILPVRGIYKQQLLLYVFQSLREFPGRLIQFRRNIERSGRNTRQANNLVVKRCRLEVTKQCIGFVGPSEYNILPEALKNILTVSSFKQQLKMHLLQNIEDLL